MKYGGCDLSCAGRASKIIPSLLDIPSREPLQTHHESIVKNGDQPLASFQACKIVQRSCHHILFSEHFSHRIEVCRKIVAQRFSLGKTCLQEVEVASSIENMDETEDPF